MAIRGGGGGNGIGVGGVYGSRITQYCNDSIPEWRASACLIIYIPCWKLFLTVVLSIHSALRNALQIK